MNIWELENCGHLPEENVGWCMICQCMWERTGIRMGRMAKSGNAEVRLFRMVKGRKGSTCN